MSSSAASPPKLSEKSAPAKLSKNTPSAPKAPKTENPALSHTETPLSKDLKDPSDTESNPTTHPQAESVKDDVEDTVSGAGEDVEDTTDKVPQKGKGKAEEEEDQDQDSSKTLEAAPKNAAKGVQNTASGLADNVKSLADKGTGAAKKATEGDTKGATDDVSSVKDNVTDTAKDTTKDVTDTAKDTTKDVTDTAKDTTKDVTDTAKDTTKDVTDTVEDTTGLDLSALKGLEVDSEGLIKDKSGKSIGRLVEGDAEDLAGYPIGDDGEILDEDGDLVGRCEIIQETAKDATENATQGDADDNKPGLDILKGLTVDRVGNIFNDDGDAVGQLVDGDSHELMGKTLNEKGEVLDDDGKVLGKAQIHPDAVEEFQKTAQKDKETAEGAAGDVKDQTEETTGDLKDKAEETAGDAKDKVEDITNEVKGKVEDTAGEAKDNAEEAKDTAESNIPGVEALEGRELNEEGNIVDDSGNVLGELTEGEVSKVKGLTVNDVGEVLDAEGNIVGKVALADGAAEVLAEQVKPDLRILEGLKVNKKGKILDSEGDVLGELIDGDDSECAGKLVNAKGEVVDKKGKVLGQVKIIPSEAVDEAMKELHERLGETEEDAEDATPGLESLDGLKVNKKGKVLNHEGDPIGELADGDLEKCQGLKCNDKGEILDKKGKVIGHVKLITPNEETPQKEEAVEDPSSNLPPLSTLEGLKVNKAGKIINQQGDIIGELVEGDAKKLSKAGTTCDKEGQFWDNQGHVIGRAVTVERENAEAEAPFAGLEGLIVRHDGLVADEKGNIVGKVVDGNAKQLVGRAVDEDGDILDKRGSVVGHAERYEEAEPEPVAEEAKPDLSILVGKKLNKQGNVVDDDGNPIGRLVEGNAKDLVGHKVAEDGLVYNDVGKVTGHCELIPDNQRVSKKEGPFAGSAGLKVVKDGKVEDAKGNVVGKITEGDHKRLIGQSVDEDGDIIDSKGNVKGHAEPWEEEEVQETPVDLSALAGCTVNKAGNVVDGHGNVVGRVSRGDPKNMINKKVDGKGQIWDNAGKVIGQAELSEGHDNKPEGPFSGFENNSVAKDGTVKTQDGSIIGRITDGDVKKLVGHKVDEDGDIVDKNGNAIGKAERWEPEEKERHINPMSGRRVNKEGEVRNEAGDIIGRLTNGDLGHCVGLEIDDNGYVVDNDGNRVGEATILENIPQEEPEESSPSEEAEEDKKKREDAELADKMANICQQTIDRVQPVMKQITEYIEQADRTKRDELNEEQLVNNVKPLIEEGARILQECNGSLRGLDPDGHIAAQAKARSKGRDGTPEEYRLADLLKELTNNVVKTIDNAKKKISDMPHAKKKLNPLWGLLTEPLYQILAAVGLLLSGVLGLVGQLLKTLGLGGLVNGLLGGLGIDKLLGGLGLGGLTDMLGSKKSKNEGGKKSGGIGSIPIVDGLLGGGS